jgi:hypothetical protein
MKALQIAGYVTENRSRRSTALLPECRGPFMPLGWWIYNRIGNCGLIRLFIRLREAVGIEYFAQVSFKLGEVTQSTTDNSFPFVTCAAAEPGVNNDAF